MPRFMDFHERLNLSGEVIAQITADAYDQHADQFGVRQIELYPTADGKVYCLVEAPDEEAVRSHHEALGVNCADVYPVEDVTLDGDQKRLACRTCGLSRRRERPPAPAAPSPRSTSEGSTEARNGDGTHSVTAPRIDRRAAVSRTRRVVARVIPTKSSLRSSA